MPLMSYNAIHPKCLFIFIMELKYYVKPNETGIGDSFDSYHFVFHITFTVKTFAAINHMSHKSAVNVWRIAFWRNILSFFPSIKQFHLEGSFQNLAFLRI